MGPHFTTGEALLHGVSRSRLRRGDLTRPHHGVRAIGPAHDLVERCRAFLPAMTEGMLFSHITAARLHGLPLGREADLDEPLHVSTRAPGRAARHRGIHGHQTRIADDATTTLHGLPVVSAVETWCQLASMLAEDDLVVCGDALVRRKEPIATMEQLAAAVASSPRRPGVRLLRCALARVRARTDSPMETVLRLALVRAGLPEPAVNYRIVGPDGDLVAHGDLAYPAAHVVVEYDGDQHRTDTHQYYIDVDRLWRIRTMGWEVVRVNRTHMANDAREAVRRVRLALALS
ncbi:hypothetical protein AXZ95_2038 [Leifsonia sp. 115AMFTsu3.1]|nr:hypothetical protein AXZ95_2038 [Leifsonia sp. 115AMFTsu3.1]